MASDKNTFRGKVLEALPQTQFLVELEGRRVICYLSGRMWKNFIKIIPGDEVDIVLAPDGGRGRIVRRR